MVGKFESLLLTVSRFESNQWRFFLPRQKMQTCASPAILALHVKNAHSIWLGGHTIDSVRTSLTVDMIDVTTDCTWIMKPFIPHLL